MSAQNVIGQCDAILDQMNDPMHKGSQVSVFLDKILAWAKNLDLQGFGADALHTLLHYVVEKLIPQLKDLAPTYGDMLLDILSSLLIQIDSKWPA